jgi:type I restriction enzyme M protein
LKNLFCSLADLKNEAAVESYFMDRLLTHLGYADEDIKLKTSISEYEVGKGSKKSLYKPDYVVLSSGIPTIVIDAKSTTENIKDWESQCSSYSLEINKEFDYNPVEYYILSNGIKTSLYQWDKKNPILEMDFDDFLDGNEKLLELEKLISKPSLAELSENLKEELEYSPFKFEKVSLDELASKFQKIHQEIWQSEKKGPSAAFQELIKIFFVKIRKDREVHLKLGDNPKPKYKDVIFSQNWIASQTETKNPINQILFKNLVSELEKDIMSGKKKRFFEKNDQINISYSTMKKVVKEIENIDLYGMEEDIHGRMFETFLDATIRGKDIGQFSHQGMWLTLWLKLEIPKQQRQKLQKF